MGFDINYYFERNGVTYVSLTRNGRNYDRQCKLDGFNRPSFRFMGKVWKPDHQLRMYWECAGD